MKSILVILIFVLSGCAVTQVRQDGMQQDGSYKVEVGGGGYTSEKTVMEAAETRMNRLCPKGFAEQSRFCDSEGIRSVCQIVAKCK